MSLFDANYEGRVDTCGNILFQPKPHYPWSHLKKHPYASSVMQKFLVAPVARATPLSLLCICCVLHAQVHPQRSARVARFARSLAARQQSDFQTSLYVLEINEKSIYTTQISKRERKILARTFLKYSIKYTKIRQ